MSKWTKGPWGVVDFSDGNKGLIAVTTAGTERKEHICDVFPFGTRPGGVQRNLEEHRANARLIASAPALAEALEKITIYRVEDDDRLWLKVNGVVICAILDDGHSDEELAALARFDAAARAALSLAKGTQGETR